MHSPECLPSLAAAAHTLQAAEAFLMQVDDQHMLSRGGDRFCLCVLLAGAAFRACLSV